MAYKDKANTIKYNNEFNRQAYDRVSLILPKGTKEEIKEHAESRGESLNSFIKRAIENQIQLDNNE